MRDQESTLRAFYNVCRHHAAQVVSPECQQGCTNKFVCPYHGWTYGLDGRLTKATKLKGIQSFKARDFGLKPIPVVEWGPLIWINLASNAREDSKDFLASLQRPKEVNSEMGEFDNCGLTYIRTVEYDMNCNWKVFVDNYLDGGYHVEHLHKDLTSSLAIESYDTEVGDGYSLQKVKGAGNDPRVGTSAVYTYLYPNVMINRYGPWMDINYIYPTGPTKSKVVYDYFLDTSFVESKSKGTLDDFISECLVASDQVQQEDSMICQSVQIGLESSAYDVGRYAPRIEMADHAFHKKLAEQYQKYCSEKID